MTLKSRLLRKVQVTKSQLARNRGRRRRQFGDGDWNSQYRRSRAQFGYAALAIVGLKGTTNLPTVRNPSGCRIPNSASSTDAETTALTID
jgi:hypothetical protein